MRALLPIAILLAACSAGPDDPLDAGPDARATGTLHLGEGELAFRAIEDGDTLLLARGCQGSQHVFVTLRSEDMDPRGMVVELELVREGSGESVSGEFRLRLSFTPDASGAFAQLTGLTLQVAEPDGAIGDDLVLRGRIEDRTGIEAHAERRVRIEWGTQVCSEPSG
ncbi:hypothetical protein [Sandaracinus amylolyticus]|uniref:hypothetical protein n=1 Tax=Sandaracinus amylolyticus TaxID=927083 RepID=UPI001F476019|nr:hypothetical protein [Sandaracinus amylolyticus]